jgi:hypothetical protein
LLKLVHIFDKKFTDKELGIKAEIEASEDNVDAIKRIMKTVLDYRLY